MIVVDMLFKKIFFTGRTYQTPSHCEGRANASPVAISLSIVILLLSIAFLTSCGHGDKGQGRPPVPVAVAKATKADIPLYLDSIGATAGLQSVRILPQVSGKILGIHFSQGSDVKKGDLLFSIDPSPYDAALQNAGGKFNKSQADLANSESQLKRSLSLASSNYVSAQDLDTLKAKVESAKGQVDSDKGVLELAKVNLDYCHIRSPIDGVTGKYLIDVGNVVSNINPSPLVSIEHLDSLYIDFTLPEKDVLQIKNALEAKGSLPVEVASLTNSSVKGQAGLRYVDNQILPGTGTVSLRAVLQNSTRQFWPGQSVKVRVTLQTLKDAILIPLAALQYGQQGPFVFTVKEDQTAEIKVVQPGQRQGDQKQGDTIAILQGLKDSDTVVVSGHLILAPGAKVMVLPPQEGSMPPSQQLQGVKPS